MRRRHWFGEQVRSIQTTLDQLSTLLPTFERYGLGRNRFQDVIARRDAAGALPVAAVSKRYVLVQHAAAVAAVTSEVTDLGIDAAAVPATLFISEYGTRVAIRAVLPDECAFVDDDGHKTALTFELFNSVDGTVPLMAAVGWFRFVCSNGLVVGRSAALIRERHSGGLDPERVSLALRVGTILALEEREQLEAWQEATIGDGPLAQWVDGPVCQKWGPYAASRVYGIVTTGKDGEPQRRPRKVPPHRRPLVHTSPVPGASTSRDAYAVVQALSWVASRRANVNERLQWRADIHELMDALLAIPAHTGETLASSFEDASPEGAAEIRTNELAHDVLS